MAVENKLHIDVSPHIGTKRTTMHIMRDVLIALMPLVIAGCVIFGWRSLLVVASTTAAAVLTEYIFCLITKKEGTVGDLSSAVTGVLLGLNLPATAPIWQCVIGSVFAIAVVKCLFGGIGQNFANPAVTARVFLLISFSGTLTFTNARKPKEVAATLPHESVLIETDCPYLAPHPKRGTLNHSGNLEYTNATLAEIWGITPEECAKITENNAKRFFGI